MLSIVLSYIPNRFHIYSCMIFVSAEVQVERDFFGFRFLDIYHFHFSIILVLKIETFDCATALVIISSILSSYKIQLCSSSVM